MPILSIITFLPLFGALFLLFARTGETNELKEEAYKRIKFVSVWVSGLTFLLSLYLLFKFVPNSSAYQFVEEYNWFGKDSGIAFKLGVDGLSIWFVILTAFLTPICILASWKNVTFRLREFMIAFLLLESLVIGVFCSLDLLLFYIFFEASLIPMFLIIGIWGGQNRIYASFKFFLYTLAGSVLFLVALIYIYSKTDTLDIPTLQEIAPQIFTKEVQIYLWLALFASFAVKIPMFPVHTWLPDAHVQAPTAGSVILAGILLKLGGYGFIRFSLPMLPDASLYFQDFVFILSAIAVIYTSLIALAQTDMKKLIAYSSIAHMGFVTIGIFTTNQIGLEGGIFQMISHGVISGALFLCVGVIYDRALTKEISRLGGLTNLMPRFALFMLIFAFASIGLPATAGFVGEFMVLLGVFQENPVISALAATGMVLGAGYTLFLVKRVMFGEIKPALAELKDIDLREKAILLPLAILTIVLGIYPELVLGIVHASAENLINQWVK